MKRVSCSILFGVVLFVVMPQTAHAGEAIWNGANGDWFDTTKWLWQFTPPAGGLPVGGTGGSAVHISNGSTVNVSGSGNAAEGHYL